MKTDPVLRHRLNPADAVTLLRIAGTALLAALRPLTAEFFCVYALTGLTDVLDGWIARKTGTASDFGARLDSIADLVFYTVLLLRIFPLLWRMLPADIRVITAAIALVRAAAYLVAAVKYRRFVSLHTVLNKLTGAAVFLIPFLLATACAAACCRAVCILAAAAALEELCIHLCRKTCRPDIKSIFQQDP